MSTNTTDERSREMRDPTKDGLRSDPFSAAADAAKTGQPLVVVCTDPMEALLTASRYGRFGSRSPLLEELNGR